MKKILTIFLIIPVLLASCEKKSSTADKPTSSINFEDSNFSIPSECEG
ncbi:hypothetical protein ACWNT8_08870 [Pigmentibacter ruber]|nr:hypothetical protein [Pigmentibacter ruber]BFD32606.1 hypothetical protein GTC16762_22240 [Pigmentibacter ruber]